MSEISNVLQSTKDPHLQASLLVLGPTLLNMTDEEFEEFLTITDEEKARKILLEKVVTPTVAKMVKQANESYQQDVKKVMNSYQEELDQLLAEAAKSSVSSQE